MAYKNNRRRKKWLVAIAVIIIIAAIMTVLEATNTTHFFHKSAIVRAPSTPITQLPTKTSATAKTPTANNGIEQGGANNLNGKTVSGVPTNPSKWSTSTSGVITVKLPDSGDTIKSGATLAGSSSVNPIQFTLIDNQVGVIAQGPITVTNGNFTASIDFTAHASSGRLDIFSTDPNGREINEVQIPINF
jgi:hypothetical protein